MLACSHVLGVCVGAVVSVAAVGLAVAAAPDVSLVLAPAASVPAAGSAADAALAVVVIEANAAHTVAAAVVIVVAVVLEVVVAAVVVVTAASAAAAAGEVDVYFAASFLFGRTTLFPQMSCTSRRRAALGLTTSGAPGWQASPRSRQCQGGQGWRWKSSQ